MKSNIEKVYSKLPKTELSKVELTKVELGIVEDFETLSNNADSNTKKANSEAKQSSNKIDGFINDAISNISRADKVFRDIESKAKDLGFDMPSNLTETNKENQRTLKFLINLRKANASLRKSI